MRLVHSSVPGAVERDQAIRLLVERATLTRMVCRELLESDIDSTDRRPQSALFTLLRWIAENQQQKGPGEPRADDGLDEMVVPEDCTELILEIKEGARVCNALFMLFTADSEYQANHDRAKIRTALAAYWERRVVPVPVMRRVS